MKTKTITYYTAQELKERFPSAFNRALEHYRDTWCNHELPWMEETIDSLKTILKDAGVHLRDWSLGAYNRGNHIDVKFSGRGVRFYDVDSETGELRGSRAMAWLENNLLAQYRVPFVSMTGSKKRREFVKYGAGYRPGMVRPCPATGYCADDSYLEALRESLRKGDTLKEAFENLASVCADLLESEDEAQREESTFLETAEANEWSFDERGERED